ncbi:MAG: glycerate kinase [Oscillospiraceae bacterium]|nr:glycerate kinase [Oscillospiraceae bacterium]
MKKCIIIPDSFKGTLSSAEICSVMSGAVRRHWPDCEIHAIPVADGGEGTVDCFLAAMTGEKVPLDATGPFGEPVKGYYARFGSRAVLEMAMFAGLPQAEGRLDPEKTTTFGVGEAIRKAVSDGCTEILLGLGGSCTNDGGCGMAAALGVRFYNKEGNAFIPAGGSLHDIVRIDLSDARQLLQNVKITAMCDIDNPLYGESGAAHVFAPQKGADEAAVRRLDDGLRHLAAVIEKDQGISVAELPGAGAAGGMGAGVVAFLGGGLRPGIEAVLDMTGFDALLDGTDLVLTGEGRIDSQSLRGKVVIGTVHRAKTKNVPVVAVVGDIGLGAEGAYDHGVTALVSISRRPIDFSVCRAWSHESLEKAMEDFCRIWKTAEK